MRELIVSNEALGDQAALARIWSEHGYWFFRDVLDKDALRALRNEYMTELRKLELVDAGSEEPMWNGKAIENFPATFEGLHQRRVWQNFTKHPKINAFFEAVLNDEISWIPIDYYRIVAPSEKPFADAYLGTHQDGMTNPGIDFVTCWMPLTDIDDQVGGLVIAADQHMRGYMGVVDGKAEFLQGPPIPEESWSRAFYHLGDVVIFAQTIPHYGLGNTSDRFRLSLDIRAARKSGRLPVVGAVKSISADEVVIATDNDGDVRLMIDDQTFIRKMLPSSPNPVPATRAEIAAAMPPGSAVMATRDAERALVLRPHL